MTRKEELDKKVNAVFQCESFGYDVGKSDVLELLIEVEREVWAKVERYYSHQIHHDMDDYPDKFVKWLKSQQQEQR